MIDARTKLTGLIGWPVEHSMSPAMHNAAFKQQGLNYCYLPLPVEANHLEAALSGLRALGFAGVNVTIPHKANVIQYLDQLDSGAEKMGVVNTIVLQDGIMTGHNTDSIGFIQSLKNEQCMIAGSSVVVLGAGGAAKAVVWGLLDEGARQVTVAGRRGSAVIEWCQVFSFDKRVQGMDWCGDNFSDKLRKADIIINCTSLGMYPEIDVAPPVNWELVLKRAFVCDLVYNPVDTKFLTDAAAHGHVTVSGVGMLVEQGILAYQLWTGLEAPRETMYQEVCRKLREKTLSEK